MGLAAYLEDGWNVLDLIIAVEVAIISLCRGVSWSDDEAEYVDVVYLAAVVMMSVSMWFRLLFTLTVIKGLGPLLISLRKVLTNQGLWCVPVRLTALWLYRW